MFVISNNKSFISQNLKVVVPLGGKFDFLSQSDLKFKAILITKSQSKQSLGCFVGGEIIIIIIIGM